MNKFLILAATVATGAAVTFAMSSNAEHHTTHAGHEMTKFDAKFNAIDTNKNGKICMKEHSAESAKKFSMRDTNKDGSLSKEELMAGRKAVMGGTTAAPAAMPATNAVKAMVSPTDAVKDAVKDAVAPAVGGAMSPAVKMPVVPAVVNPMKQ